MPLHLHNTVKKCLFFLLPAKHKLKKQRLSFLKAVVFMQKEF